MRTWLAFLTLAVCNAASAAVPQEMCDNLGTLAGQMAAERDKGVTYGVQKARIRSVARATGGDPALGRLMEGVAKTVYVDMPRLTPEGAYKFVRVMCMTAQ